MDTQKNNLLRQGAQLQNGRYTIIRVLGQGGFGITYLARDTRTDTVVAVKEFFPVVSAAIAFQPLVIQHKALDHVLLQARGSPLAESCASLGLYAIADGSDDFKVVNDLRAPFGICLQNMQTILFVHFAFFEYVANV